MRQGKVLCPLLLTEIARLKQLLQQNELRAGGMGYGDLKKMLFEVYWEHFAAARAKRLELLSNMDYVNKVLADGAARARAKATEVLKRARKASGLE
jgi:tryptophanyl-tRNA synthetase